MWDFGDDRPSAASHTLSSPHARIVPTPMRPSRLTLPVDQPEPEFLPPRSIHRPVPQRPMTSLQQFAYAPPTPKRTTDERYDNSGSPMTTKSQRIMPPPSVPPLNRSRFIPSDISTPRKALPQARSAAFEDRTAVQQRSNNAPRTNLNSLKASSYAKDPVDHRTTPALAKTNQLPAFRPASTVGFVQQNHAASLVGSNPTRIPLPQQPQHTPSRVTSVTPLFRPGTSSGNRLPFRRT